MPTNDNEPRPPGPVVLPSDAYGRAALLLIESLLHGLYEKLALNAEEMVEIAERAVSVQSDQAQASDEQTAASMWHAHSLLLGIMASLQLDVTHDPKPPHLVR